MLHDTQHKPFKFRCLSQQFTVVPGNATHGTDVQIPVTVLHQIPTEKLSEMLIHQLPYFRDMKMATDIRRSGGEPAIGQRLTVDTRYNITHRHLLFFKELIDQWRRKETLEQRIQETDTQHGTAALVTEDIA